MAKRKTKQRMSLFSGGIVPFLLLIVGLGLALLATQVNTNFLQEAAQRKKVYVPKYFTFVLPDKGASPGELFVVKVVDHEIIDRLHRVLQGKSQEKLFVSGIVSAGYGEFNKSFGVTESGNWGWHLDPVTIMLDGSYYTESCDVRPSDIEANVSLWLQKRFCPFDVTVRSGYDNPRYIKTF